jgi:hypothetical protein
MDVSWRNPTNHKSELDGDKAQASDFTNASREYKPEDIENDISGVPHQV